ncbi:CHAT domain-containing protein [Armatimonas sp.]|uniref:CHAT domain-containing protein n=1 Tax=Armatimonas sp. TaxID=1872638 RepID=UPI00286BC3BB|nr:CHAT domain-containing protein [Armatimonas sp.]
MNYYALLTPLALVAYQQSPAPVKETPPPASVMEAIKKAEALVKAEKFAEAITILEARQKELGKKITEAEKRALLIATAEIHFARGEEAESHSEHKEAILHYQAAYEIDKTYRKVSAGIELHSIGAIYDDIGNKSKVLEFYNKALQLFEITKSKDAEASLLGDFGSFYNSIGDKNKALDFFKKSLSIQKEIGDKGGELITTNNIGVLHESIGDNAKALDFYNKALLLLTQTETKRERAVLLSNIGKCHYNLGNKEKSIEFYNKALLIQRQIENKSDEATTLNNISTVYRDLGENEKALEALNQALHIFTQKGLKNREATTLNNIGAIYSALGNKEKSLESHKKALLIHQSIHNKEGEAYSLFNIGDSYSKQGDKTKALELYNQALSLQRQVGDKRGEAITLKNLMMLWNNKAFQKQSLGMAVLYGKQAINLYQFMRNEIKSLDKSLQDSYTKSVSVTYRQLADLLIEQGRLAEAQQVLGLLKDQELSEFVQRDAKVSGEAAGVALTPKEAEMNKRYQEISEKLTKLGARQAALSAKRQRTAEEEREREQLGEDLQVATITFQNYLVGLEAEFARVPLAQQQLVAVKDAQTLSRTLSDLTKDTKQSTLAIYTLVGEEKLSFIVVTGNVQVAREYPITAVALNKLVAQFRTALEDPRLDPRPLGKKLYDILIAPIENDLKGADATRVYWSLDGTLRYLPLAALSPDGIHYLIEREEFHSLFSPRVKERLVPFFKDPWYALGLGVSKGATIDGVSFSPLPAAATEVQEITKALEGKALLDEAFTKSAMLKALDGSFPVVHIASHFQFQPGNETRSYLLLGNGATLPLTELRQLPNTYFNGVELLTLSACNTAMGGGDSAGAEVESFALLMQLKGAGAVMASLWPVSDSSTQQLMQAFYATRKASPTLSKSECLRQAQLGLLKGTIKPEVTTRGPVAATGGKAPATVPAFVPDPGAPCAHPYYWAPFILIGNTR